VTAPRLLSGDAIMRLLNGSEREMPRQRCQNPTLRQRKDGLWYILPWVDVRDGCGGTVRMKKRIVLGPLTKREAIIKRNQVMETINNSKLVLQSQIKFGYFLDNYYIKSYLDRPGVLKSTTQAAYMSHIRVHIRPTWGEMQMSEITTRRLDDWMAALTKAGLSYNARHDLLTMMSGIFTKAEDWGVWDQRNPCKRVTVGRNLPVREKRMLTDQQIRLLLAALPDNGVRLMAEIALFCTLRVSEIMGLQWKHIDFENGCIHVRQRMSNDGELAEPKTRKALRDPQMGHLAERLKAFKYAGVAGNAAPGTAPVSGIATRQHQTADDFVFRFPSRNGGYLGSNDLVKKYLKPAAKAIGIDHNGFAWHSLRRQAVTNYNSSLGVTQAMNMAGHSTVAMSALYTMSDADAANAAVRAFQERIAGEPTGGVQ